MKTHNLEKISTSENTPSLQVFLLLNQIKPEVVEHQFDNPKPLENQKKETENE